MLQFMTRVAQGVPRYTVVYFEFVRFYTSCFVICRSEATWCSLITYTKLLVLIPPCDKNIHQAHTYSSIIRLHFASLNHTVLPPRSDKFLAAHTYLTVEKSCVASTVARLQEKQVSRVCKT